MAPLDAKNSAKNASMNDLHLFLDAKTSAKNAEMNDLHLVLGAKTSAKNAEMNDLHLVLDPKTSAKSAEMNDLHLVLGAKTSAKNAEMNDLHLVLDPKTSAKNAEMNDLHLVLGAKTSAKNAEVNDLHLVLGAKTSAKNASMNDLHLVLGAKTSGKSVLRKQHPPTVEYPSMAELHLDPRRSSVNELYPSKTPPKRIFPSMKHFLPTFLGNITTLSILIGFLFTTVFGYDCIFTGTGQQYTTQKKKYYCEGAMVPWSSKFVCDLCQYVGGVCNIKVADAQWGDGCGKCCGISEDDKREIHRVEDDQREIHRVEVVPKAKELREINTIPDFPSWYNAICLPFGKTDKSLTNLKKLKNLKAEFVAKDPKTPEEKASKAFYAQIPGEQKYAEMIDSLCKGAKGSRGVIAYKQIVQQRITEFEPCFSEKNKECTWQKMQEIEDQWDDMQLAKKVIPGFLGSSTTASSAISTDNNNNNNDNIPNPAGKNFPVNDKNPSSVIATSNLQGKKLQGKKAKLQALDDEEPEVTFLEDVGKVDKEFNQEQDLEDNTNFSPDLVVIT